jgi:uncharacterized membrane protein YfcA
MVDVYIIAAMIIVILVGAALGSFLTGVVPYFRKLKAKEDEVEEILEIEPEKRTPEQNWKVKRLEETRDIPFLRRYYYTVILGILTGFMFAMTSTGTLIAEIPGEVSLISIFTAFTQALGLSGTFTAVSNQVIKTK